MIIILLILSFTSFMTVFAENNDILQIESIEFEKSKDEIYALKDEISEYINNTIRDENEQHLYSNKTHNYITAEDINFTNMYKEYYNIDEILTKNLKGKKAIDFFKNCDYVWIMPFSFDDISIIVVLTRGQPIDEERAYSLIDENGNRLLSDEKIAELKAREGHWYINSIGIDYLDTRYENSIIQANDVQYTKAINNTLYYIFIPNLHTSAAFIATNDGNYINCFNKYLLNENNINSTEIYIKQNEIINLYEKYALAYQNINANGDMRAGGVLSVDTPEHNSNSINPVIISIMVIIAILIFLFAKKCRFSGIKKI